MGFLKNVLAVLVGLLVFSFVSIFFISIFLVAISQEKPVITKENTVLHVKLDQKIVERETNDPLAELMPGAMGRSAGLVDLRRALEHAHHDDNVKGILLEAPFITSGIASAMEIRQMLAKFKESGKFVIAYADYYTEGGYYVASVADEVYVAPDFGMLEFNGLSSQRVYFKGTLKKLGVEPIVFRAGKYKSAAESFVESEMTQAEREQVAAYVESIYGNILEDISESRDIPTDELKNIAGNMLVRQEVDAEKYGLVDKLAYRDEVIRIVKDKVGVSEEDKIPLMSYSSYNQSFQDDYSSRNTIGVLIATGDIVMGQGRPDNISPEVFTKELKKLRENDRVKAVVLRVNSGGGSALASDLIWREMKLTAEKKPVIASMSDVAASGGYYIAMAADTIVAMPTTITGSIGVIGLYLNAQQLLNEKLGVTTDHYNTGQYSDLLNASQPVKEEEIKIVQKMIDDAYHIFSSKAAEDRNMEYDQLHNLAQGRVWTGQDALAQGLVDVEGNLTDAIDIAAEKAAIAGDFKVKYYPEQKTVLEQFLAELSGNKEARFLDEALPEARPYIETLMKIKDKTGIQARMPYDLYVEF